MYQQCNSKIECQVPLNLSLKNHKDRTLQDRLAFCLSKTKNELLDIPL